jgi:hypothetical protein
MIPIFFTVETSLGFYFDPQLQKTLSFDRKKWEQIGLYVVMAIKEYYEDLEQLEEFVESKKKGKKEETKGNNNSSPTRRNGKEPKKEEIKLFKIYE